MSRRRVLPGRIDGADVLPAGNVQPEPGRRQFGCVFGLCGRFVVSDRRYDVSVGELLGRLLLPAEDHIPNRQPVSAGYGQQQHRQHQTFGLPELSAGLLL